MKNRKLELENELFKLHRTLANKVRKALWNWCDQNKVSRRNVAVYAVRKTNLGMSQSGPVVYVEFPGHRFSRRKNYQPFLGLIQCIISRLAAKNSKVASCRSPVSGSHWRLHSVVYLRNQ